MMMKIRENFDDVDFTETDTLIIQDAVLKHLQVVKKDFDDTKEVEDLQFLKGLIVNIENLLEKIK